MSLHKIWDIVFKQIQPQMNRYILFQFADAERFNRWDPLLAKLAKTEQEMNELFKKVARPKDVEAFFPNTAAGQWEYNRMKRR